MKKFDRVKAVVSLDAIAHNFEEMKKNIAEGTKIVAVIKADGYGHGAEAIARLIEDYEYIWGYATATPEEALQLRDAGIDKPILILGIVFEEYYKELIAHEVRMTVCEYEMAAALSEEAVRQGRQKIVMRISSKLNLTRDIKELGLDQEEMATLQHMLAKPYGIMFVTGPTGSGKSTTLYTALSALNKEAVNIVTVEDPVEADLEGINQIQVNNKVDLTFASALRSILRQDPDIIMIGEIRDQETASIAVQASITGHLVVSTMHTNNAVGTLNRMADMGVARYLISDAIIGVIAQRLVRKLCPHCRKKRFAMDKEKRILRRSLAEEV